MFQNVTPPCFPAFLLASQVLAPQVPGGQSGFALLEAEEAESLWQ